MTKNEMRTLIEYLKSTIVNTISSNDPTEEETLFIYGELSRFCANEVSCITFDKIFLK